MPPCVSGNPLFYDLPRQSKSFWGARNEKRPTIFLLLLHPEFDERSQPKVAKYYTPSLTKSNAILQSCNNLDGRMCHRRCRRTGGPLAALRLVRATHSFSMLSNLSLLTSQTKTRGSSFVITQNELQVGHLI